MTTAKVGDEQYLGSILANVHCWGVVRDLDTPAMTTATFEVLGNDGALVLDAIVGPQGTPGQNAPIVKMQYGSSIDDPADLPLNLTNTAIDIGKAWWIGSLVYMWDGTMYVAKEMGSQGPPGPVPRINPSVQLLDPDDPHTVSSIELSGTAAAPGWLLKLKAPRGPQGDNATIRDATDYSEVASGAPTTGDVITWNGRDYEPRQAGSIRPLMYTIPEANFTSFSGITTRQQIASFTVPPQEWAWVPWVMGHIRAVGLEADTDPLILGCEVRLGDASAGVLVGRGFGNSSTWTTIVPHTSTNQSPNDSITPENGWARVPAGASGPQSTLYVNLFNDGVSGAYAFNKQQAQLAVMLLPVD